jgi:2-dehydro-3-deoxygluconokinase
MPTVVCSGETMALLHTPNGRLRHAGRLELGIGGAESNVAIGLARLGIDSGWVSRLGDDEPGELVLSRIRAEGVNVDQVARSPAATGLYLRDAPVAGPRVFYYRAGSAASELAPGSIDAAYLDGARFLHISGITPALSDSCREYTHWLIEQARARGVTVSFDINFRAKLWSAEAAADFVSSILAKIDVLFVSDEEARALWQRDDDRLLSWLAEQGPNQVLLKCADQGCRALIDDVFLDGAAFAVSTVNTTGAGDAFAAGFIAAQLWEASAPQALRFAQAMGACCVAGAGDYESLPDREELMRFADGVETLER